MIVKFIAVICLLLFIPKLEIIKKKVSNKDDDDEERNFSSRKSSERISELPPLQKFCNEFEIRLFKRKYC